ncbi:MULTISPECIES: InlB B-repeat-containing protein [unclassified Salinibacterium]|uniref:InlB B-repeat-containing protein n=1 Tax=unclassified Salinibacterium TaxID=2632331 RepID=UPI00141D93C0|nr:MULTISPECIES: InlB B-repeat-containing protein [unclassified Salinibacterium]
MTTLRTISAAAAALTTAGVSTLGFGADAAHAAAPQVACDAGGTLIAADICELAFTATPGTPFVPTTQMGTLEALLVGAGGDAGAPSEPNDSQYAAAGGGGQVTIIDATGGEAVEVVVPAPGVYGGVTVDGTAHGVANGSNGRATSNGNGGTSGGGALGTSASSLSGGAGGGAGGAASGIHGGAGVVVADLASSGSLFAGDTRCFGGGGAVLDRNEEPDELFGRPGCGGGSLTGRDAAGVIAPAANSGGGAAGTTVTGDGVARAGAHGFVALRWRVVEFPVAFVMNGHGTAPATQIVSVGTAPTAPALPAAEGWEFGGWFADEALTVPADFSQPITGSTAFYAKWTAALAATGARDATPQLALGIAGALAGVVLLAAIRMRRPRES